MSFLSAQSYQAEIILGVCIGLYAFSLTCSVLYVCKLQDLTRISTLCSVCLSEAFLHSMFTDGSGRCEHILKKRISLLGEKEEHFLPPELVQRHRLAQQNISWQLSSYSNVLNRLIGSFISVRDLCIAAFWTLYTSEHPLSKVTAAEAKLGLKALGQVQPVNHWTFGAWRRFWQSEVNSAQDSTYFKINREIYQRRLQIMKPN